MYYLLRPLVAGRKQSNLLYIVDNHTRPEMATDRIGVRIFYQWPDKTVIPSRHRVLSVSTEYSPILLCLPISRLIAQLVAISNLMSLYTHSFLLGIYKNV